MNPDAGASTTALGADGEQQGRRILERHGYRIVTLNYRTRFGEIDAVARHRGTLVFVEIKYRRSSAFGSPAAAVTTRKQQRIIRSAVVYLKSYACKGDDIRFDVLAIGPGAGVYELIPSAFTVPPESGLVW